jgi:hypothetical protein
LGHFPCPPQKIHKNEIKLKVYFFDMLNCPRIIKKHYYELILPTKIYFQNKKFFFHPPLWKSDEDTFEKWGNKVLFLFFSRPPLHMSLKKSSINK